MKGFLKMPKFFVTQDKISDNQIIIDSEDVTHISRVLRLEKGDNVTVCDGQGTDYDAQIDTIEPKKILLNIVSRQKSETEPNIKVTLFQALPKASKMEYIIQKTTELGISEIVPVKLSRCVVKIDNKKDEKKKIDRWQKIAESAAKQSGRAIVPTVAEFMTINEVIEKSKEFVAETKSAEKVAEKTESTEVKADAKKADVKSDAVKAEVKKEAKADDVVEKVSEKKETVVAQQAATAQKPRVIPAEKASKESAKHKQKKAILNVLEKQYKQVRCSADAKNVSGDSFCRQEERRLFLEIQRIKDELRGIEE